MFWESNWDKTISNHSKNPDELADLELYKDIHITNSREPILESSDPFNFEHSKVSAGKGENGGGTPIKPNDDPEAGQTPDPNAQPIETFNLGPFELDLTQLKSVAGIGLAQTIFLTSFLTLKI